MCELIPGPSNPGEVFLTPGHTYTLHKGGSISQIPAMDDKVLQCWHPETKEWSTMLPPVDGMAWQLSPGSKIRIVEKKKAGAPAPSMVKQVEAVGRS